MAPRFAVLAAACLLGGCTSALNRPGTLIRSDMLTAPELSAQVKAGASTFDAIRHLRPLFFLPRPGFSELHGKAPKVMVFVNGLFAGEADVLQAIPVREIKSVRHLGREQAYTMLGSRAGDAVLLVELWPE